MRWIVVACAAIVAGWLAIDGTRALLTGDYFTRHGQLGPWADLLRRAGLEPRSTGVKVFYACYGYAWLAVIAAYVSGAAWAWRGMLAAAAGSLWFLPVGTALGLLQIALLLLLRR